MYKLIIKNFFSSYLTEEYATGLKAAAVEKKLSSEMGFKGIFKKVIIFSLVAVGHIIDTHVIREVVLCQVLVQIKSGKFFKSISLC